MKKLILFTIISLLAFPIFSQVMPTVGVLRFEASIPEIAALEEANSRLSGAERTANEQAIAQATLANAVLIAELNEIAAQLQTLLVNELRAWEIMTIMSGEGAEAAEFLIRGTVSRQNNQIMLTAFTYDRRNARTLNTSRAQGEALRNINIETFCEQIGTYIPVPNFLQGTWISTINLIDGPVVAILEFLSDRRTVRVHRYDTWEHDAPYSLRYQAIGTGTYTYTGYRRRSINVDSRTIQADATVSITLNLEDALPEFTSIEINGLRVLFDDARDNFEFTAGSLPFGNNFSGPSVYPGERISYISFSKIQAPGFFLTQSGVPTAASTMTIQAAPVWSRNLGSRVLGQPYLMAESVVVAVGDGSVKSFYMTGSELWDYQPMDQVSPHFARSVEGATYLSDSAGIFQTINRVGNELWRENLPGPVSFQPVVGWDGRVFIPVGSQIFTRTAAGSPLWSKELNSNIILEPILDHAGSIVMVLENRDFVRLTQFSAEERISLNEIPLLISPIVSSSQQCYILYYPDGRTEMITFNETASRGSRLTRAGFITLESTPVAAVGRANMAAITLRDGRIQLIDDSGRILWTGNTHETTEERGTANLNTDITTMIFDNRGIYVITTKGITAFTDDGRRRFIHKHEEASSISGFSEEGMLYVSTANNFIRAYKLDTRALNIRRSRYYGPMPEGNYGLGNPPPSPWSIDDFRWDPNEQARMTSIIENMIDSGQIGENEPLITAYLHEMIGFFLNEGHYSTVRPRVLPFQHIAYIRLLGRFGSRDTVPFLLTIFNRYHEPAVLSAVAEAVGRIGVDPEGTAFVSYSFFLTPNNPHRDPQLLLSAAGSIADLIRFSGPPLAGDGLVLLRFFSNLSWIPLRIRNQINEEIDALYMEGAFRTIE